MEQEAVERLEAESPEEAINEKIAQDFNLAPFVAKTQFEHTRRYFQRYLDLERDIGEMAFLAVSAEAPPGSNVLLRNGIGFVEGEDLDDGAGRAVGLLSFERLGAVEGLFRDSAGLTTIGSGLGFESVEPAFGKSRSQRASVDGLTVEQEEFMSLSTEKGTIC